MTVKKAPPNIVLMVSDDHGREAVGCYGNPVVKTPNIDALAGDGVRFRNAFCTSASCAASRSAILTGHHNHTNGTYGHTHGIHHFSSFSWVKSLPAWLNETGYRTGQIGKKHYAPESVYPFKWCGKCPEHERDDVAMSEQCREFVSGEDPFLLYWCSHNPHRGGTSPEIAPFCPDRFGNPAESFPNDREITYRDSDVQVPPFLEDNPEIRAEISQYYQSISRLDRGVGRLVEILKQNKKYDNTLIIYISDNGSAFPGSKTTLYETGMRLPCIVKPPQSPHDGSSRDALVSWVDITPTILDYAGVTTQPEDFFGMSFRRVLETSGLENWRKEIYAAHSFHEITNYYPMRVVRTEKHKFIWNIASPLTFSFAADLWESSSWRSMKDAPGGYMGRRRTERFLHRPRFELYDIETDPDETLNLAEDKNHAALVEEFSRKIKDFQIQTNDPWLHKWEYE